MKEKIKKAKGKVKEFWNKNKYKILIAIGAIGTVAGGAIMFVLSQQGNSDISEESCDVSNHIFPKNLDYPDWGDSYDIRGYIQENQDTKVLMVEMPINRLSGSEFGDKFIWDCEPVDPDLKAYVLVEYDSLSDPMIF